MASETGLKVDVSSVSASSDEDRAFTFYLRRK